MLIRLKPARPTLLAQFGAGLLLIFASLLPITAAPIKIAYSDWPGWVAWEIALQKGWLKEAGVDAEFVWSAYGPSMEAFAAGKVDAVMITNGDALVTGANGAKSVMILLTDYSNGNDMIVAGPGVKSIADLAGKKIGLEVGVVEHLLLVRALKKAGLTEADVTLINTPTDQTPALLASGQVAAIGAWQPVAGEALATVPGAHAIFTSADEIGLIYDGLAVSPQSLAERRSDWLKVLSVWDRIIRYIRDPATQGSAIEIMSARSGSDHKQYARMISGTRFLTLEEGFQKMTAKATAGLGSLKVSSLIANDFNLKNHVYPASQEVDSYFDARLATEALAR